MSQAGVVRCVGLREALPCAERVARRRRVGAVSSKLHRAHGPGPENFTTKELDLKLPPDVTAVAGRRSGRGWVLANESPGRHAV